MKKIVLMAVLAMGGLTMCQTSLTQKGNREAKQEEVKKEPVAELKKEEPSEPASNKAVVGLGMGNIAPDLAFADPSGKILKLSDLRGKVVLIDFWASWCGPCRRENPNVVRAYKKYNKAKFKTADGFEIYSVSLDKNKAAWEKAIQQDRLEWPYHVSDLKGWNAEPAAIYGVRSIPMSFLLDEEGVIIGANLRGTNLDMALDKLVRKL